MQKRIYLVRHCSASGQEADAELTPEGREQAKGLGEELSGMEVERIVSSPFLRAKDSVAPLALRLGLDVEVDDRLKERVLCNTHVLDWRDQLAASFDDMDIRLQGGVSSREAMARGIQALEDIFAHRALVTVIVTHGNLLTLILKHFDDSVGFTHWEQLTNPDAFRIDSFEGAYTVTRIREHQ